MEEKQAVRRISDFDILNRGNPFYRTDLTDRGSYGRLKCLFVLNKDGKSERFVGMGSSYHYLVRKGEYKVQQPARTLFCTGDIRGIRLYKEEMAAVRGEMCPCCGAPLKNIPWNPTKYYCDKCDANFFPPQKTPWSKYEKQSQPAIWWIDI